MTYFNPKIFCKQNLKEKDKKEIDFWAEQIENLIDFTMAAETEEDPTKLDEIKNDIIEQFCQELKVQLGYSLQDVVVNMINSYEEPVEEVEEPDTYLFKEPN